MAPSSPTKAQVRRWRRRLADERAEAAVYRDLASRRTGEEREILLALADAEKRHEQHWVDLLGTQVGYPRRGALHTRFVGLLARRFGSVFVLALAQRAEQRTPYDDEPDATDQMAADEHIHAEVIRALAARGRLRLAGTFRAAVFGANDGLVSNLALVLGVGASGVSNSTILVTGVAGLLAGALSMGAGEYVSVRSQRELLDASNPAPDADAAVLHLDVDANELTLVYRARGLSEDEARARAADTVAALAQLPVPDAVAQHARPVAASPDALPGLEADGHGQTTAADDVLRDTHPAEGARATDAAASGTVTSDPAAPSTADAPEDPHEAIGSAWHVALSSFLCFASGAIVPVLPYLFGMQGLPAVIVAAGVVGVALLVTGAIVGLLSGTSPLTRALRQLAIGYGAATVTYLLGLLFDTTVT